jgi:hypothetical protein
MQGKNKISRNKIQENKKTRIAQKQNPVAVATGFP